MTRDERLLRAVDRKRTGGPFSYAHTPRRYRIHTRLGSGRDDGGLAGNR